MVAKHVRTCHELGLALCSVRRRMKTATARAASCPHGWAFDIRGLGVDAAARDRRDRLRLCGSSADASRVRHACRRERAFGMRSAAAGRRERTCNVTTGRRNVPGARSARLATRSTRAPEACYPPECTRRPLLVPTWARVREAFRRGHAFIYALCCREATRENAQRDHRIAKPPGRFSFCPERVRRRRTQASW